MVILAVIPLLHWLAVHTGSVAGGNAFSNFFGGIGSDFPELAIIGVVVHHINCHTPGCWRIGKHRTKDGYHLCKTCVGKPLSELGLHPIHDDHTA